MGINKEFGDKGEMQVVELVPCPNCSKELMLLPPNYPLFDVQCSGCSFRAQIKSVNSKPKDSILGAGWDVMDKVLKSGFMSPPLIVNFNWFSGGEHYQEIRFYPFVPQKNLSKYQLSESARRANYRMFRYVGLSKVPYFVLYNST